MNRVLPCFNLTSPTSICKSVVSFGLLNCNLTQPAGATGILSRFPFGSGNGSNLTFTASVPYLPLDVISAFISGAIQDSGWSYSKNGQQVTLTFVAPPANGVAVTADVAYSQAGFFDDLDSFAFFAH